MFEDVYDVLPTHLQEQQAELRAHMARWPEQFEGVNI